ncbi:MAG: hypothetical protein KF746_27495 [Chitinophagaceae bacterium]|nr:hypothetical protein [Chitinophagaceae bacterium]
MKLIFTLCIILLCSVSCKKETENFYNSDLKKKSISSIKNFLSGKWQIQYAYIWNYATIERREYYSAKNMITFFPVDSILWKSEVSNNIITQTKIYYTQGRNGYNENSTILTFPVTALGYNYSWIPDRTKNDTLIILDNGNLGSSYYLTKIE